MRHLSSGDILRAERASGSPLARELARYMGAGELVPDKIVVDVMAKVLTAGSPADGILLDGFPRTVAQAQALDAQLVEAGQPLDAVVVIDVADEDIVARITGRRSCGKCGRIYHVKFLPPRQDGLCDDCGERLVQRDDDTEAVVRQRLEAYHRQTRPVIAYYSGRPDLRVIRIDGSGSPDQVAASLIEAVEGSGVEG